MEQIIRLRICYLKDVLGNTYVGFKIFPYAIQGLLNQWFENFECLVESDFKTFYGNRERRDGTNYHSTLINVPEFHKKEMWQTTQDLIGRDYKLTIKGVGRAHDEAKGCEAHFIVLECPALDKLRESLNLPKRDLHITIGFEGKDVFNRPKDHTSIFLPWESPLELAG